MDDLKSLPDDGARHKSSPKFREFTLKGVMYIYQMSIFVKISLKTENVEAFEQHLVPIPTVDIAQNILKR